MRCTTELTEAEVNHFFNVEIGIPELTMVKLRKEGIERLENLVEFNSDNAKDIAEASLKLGSLVPSSANARASMIPVPRAQIGARPDHVGSYHGNDQTL